MSGRAEDGFLGRWSKRKLAETEPAFEQAEDVQQDPNEQGPHEALAGKSDQEILQELGLPDPDELTDGDDFKRFMASAVPARLRNRALRRLWLTNPVLANLDELVDYGEDYTDAATVVENLQTAYQVGKGWLKDKIDDDEADERPGEPETATAFQDEDQPGDACAQDEVEPEPEPEDALAVQGQGSPEVPDEPVAVAAAPEPEPMPVPRRMRFRFDSE